MTKDSDCKVYRVFTHSKKAYLTFALLAIILTSCRDTSAIETGMPARVVFPTAEATGAQAYWPTAGWRTSSPEEQGMDPALLGHMFEAIEDKSLDVHSVVVVRNGYIVAEEYYPPYQQDTKHVLYSVTKSVTSALVGIAIEEGAFDGVDQWVVDFFPDRTFENLDSRKEAMTLEHLLTMTAGLDWEEGMSTYMAMYRSEDWVSYALDATMIAEPGEQFVYCSGCSHVLSAIVQETTGMSTLEYAQSRLFEPLGITDVYWEPDGSGIPIGGWGLELTPRDMAKFGYLYLNDGVWDGRQIVPAEWVAASVQKQVEAGMLDYGYQWWIHPTLDAYAAIGREAQLIFVMPDRDIVVVFTAQLDSADVLFDLIEDYVVPATDMVTNIDGNAIGTTSPATLNTSAERMPKYQWAYNGDGDLDAIAVNPETGHIVWLNEMD